MSLKDKSVVVAMSGGVDSSVAAGLLVQQGYNVVGATLLFHPCVDDENVSWCCGAGARDQASAVAGKLGIPFYAIDCAAEFEAAVLRPAWDEYDRGRTPSPCMACNREIKFNLLFDLACKLGAAKVATGHYARLEQDKKTASPVLLRGKDLSKDQSYFLFSLSTEQLIGALFPLGELQKSEVRSLAREMEFANADRKESQDACFSYGEGGFAEGLRVKFSGAKRSGQIVDTSGNELGEHRGIHLFTVGQRKGLRVALGQRAYVARIDADRCQVIMSPETQDLESKILRASKVVWPDSLGPDLPLRCRAKIRYRHAAAEAVVEPEGNERVVVRFDEPQRAITPGQAVVFYDSDRVLGGGWIDGI